MLELLRLVCDLVSGRQLDDALSLPPFQMGASVARETNTLSRNLWLKSQSLWISAKLCKYLPGYANDSTPVVWHPVPFGGSQGLGQDNGGTDQSRWACEALSACPWGGVTLYSLGIKTCRIMSVDFYIETGGDRIFEYSLLETWVGPSWRLGAMMVLAPSSTNLVYCRWSLAMISPF